MSKAVKLKINSNSGSIQKINQIDPYEVRKLILDQGYEDLTLIGIPIEEYRSGIHLWIEQDVDFLIDLLGNKTSVETGVSSSSPIYATSK